MTDRYANGKIYSIRSPQTDKYYIGSTCLELCKRLYKHRIGYKGYMNGKGNYMSSFDIIKLEDHYIELIEIFPCTTKAELEKREGELQRLHKADTVNRTIAGRGRAEHYQDNKVAIYEKQKQYNKDNKAAITEYSKQYNKDNKVAISEQKKQYYKVNRESINEKHRLAYLAKKTEKSSDTNKTEAQEI